MPGISPITPSTAPATASARGWPNTWPSTCLPMSCDLDTRVTITAVAIESISAGTCATRPSPMVSNV